MASVDVTVRGAGIFGLSVAWACVQRGARVRVVDPNGPGAGASGGIVGALAPHVPETWNEKKAFQLDSLLMAEAFWTGVADAGGGAPGYARTGRVQPILDEAGLELARGRARGAAELWRGKALWEVVEAGKDSWRLESPTGWVIRDTLSARLHPRRSCEALVAALGARGVPVVPAAPDAGAVVWATGWEGLRALSESLGKKVGDGVKGQAVLLAFSTPLDAPQVFVQGLHVVPHDDGTVAIGSTSERDFALPDTVDDQIDGVLQRAREALPVLGRAAVLARWAGVRPRARSRAPLLGAWPGRPGHFVANGGFKIGFGMAPKVAAVLADLVLDGHDTIPEAFRLQV